MINLHNQKIRYMLIANPIYDAVFKYMMEDNRVAKIMLSALLQTEIIDIEIKKHEHTTFAKELKILRIDFSARIRNNEGQENLVCIELQKAWLHSELMRFREYLALQLSDKNNTYLSSQSGKQEPLHIISIYLLGHTIGNIKEPIIYVDRICSNQDHKTIKKGLPNLFIDSLSNDMIIVQIPFLTGSTRNHLDRLLNIFDQNQKYDDVHLLKIKSDEYQDDENAQIVLRRLQSAIVDEEIRENMSIEDEIINDFEEKNYIIEKQKEQLIEKDEQIANQSEQLIEKDEQIANQKMQIEKAICNLAKQGLQIEQIANMFALNINEINTILNK